MASNPPSVLPTVAGKLPTDYLSDNHRERLIREYCGGTGLGNTAWTFTEQGMRGLINRCIEMGIVAQHKCTESAIALAEKRASDLQKCCEALLDIWDDGHSKPHDLRMYTEGSLGEAIAELRAITSNTGG